MAVRKTNRKTGRKAVSRGSQALVIFWLLFVIVIISVFMANAQTIEKNFNLFKTRLTTTPNQLEEPLMAEENPEEPAAPPREQREPASPGTTPVTAAEPPAKPTGGQTDGRPSAEPQISLTERPPAQPPPPVSLQPQPETPKSVQTRDRDIYFTQINKDGQILQAKVTRKIPVSDSPMLDVLKVLLAGPSADELNRGILNLIPQNTQMLSAAVRGNTAYINFNEYFQFNTFGGEGYVAQLRQIVWTVTEFSNVNDVQILIEGRRLDYLGEGIWIGSPISRQSF